MLMKNFQRRRKTLLMISLVRKKKFRRGPVGSQAYKIGKAISTIGHIERVSQMRNIKQKPLGLRSKINSETPALQELKIVFTLKSLVAIKIAKK